MFSIFAFGLQCPCIHILHLLFTVKYTIPSLTNLIGLEHQLSPPVKDPEIIDLSYVHCKRSNLSLCPSLLGLHAFGTKISDRIVGEACGTCTSKVSTTLQPLPGLRMIVYSIVVLYLNTGLLMSERFNPVGGFHW